jgi:hypothetical protein
MTSEFGSDRTAKKFTKPSDGANEDGVTPILARVEQTQVGRQTREDKILDEHGR